MKNKQKEWHPATRPLITETIAGIFFIDDQR
jgi:hypothetical protein